MEGWTTKEELPEAGVVMYRVKHSIGYERDVTAARVIVGSKMYESVDSRSRRLLNILPQSSDALRMAHHLPPWTTRYDTASNICIRRGTTATSTVLITTISFSQHGTATVLAG